MKMKNLFAGAVAFCFFASTVWAGKELLIKAKDKNGNPTALFEKVVVTSSLASIYNKPDDNQNNTGDPIEPYSIFFKLKTDEGQEELPSWIRVGDGEGKSLGWIRKKDRNDRNTLSSWNTRFVLEPVQDPNRKFIVSGKDGGKATLQSIPEGRRRLALVTTPPDKEQGEDTKFPVMVYTGKIGTQKGALQMERKKLDDLKLEIVFVIENTPGMVMFKAENMDAWESTKNLIRDTVGQLAKDPEIKKAVRYGLVEFQDDVKDKTFKNVAEQRFTLTNDSDAVISKINSLTNANFNSGDWPEDGLAGINLALDKTMGWSENSSKHLIFISASSLQIHPKGKGPDHFNNPEGQIDKLFKSPRVDVKSDCGWNTCKLSIDQILNKARPQEGGAVEKARNAITFHCILAGRDSIKAPPQYPIDPEQLYKLSKQDALDIILRNLKNLTTNHFEFLINENNKTLEKKEVMTAEQIKSFVENIKNGEEAAVEVFLKFSLRILTKELLNKLDRERAIPQFTQLAKNNGDIQGILKIMEPSLGSINETRENLKKTLAEAFNAFVLARSGRIKSSGDLNQNNAITNSIYLIVDAAGNEIKDQDSFDGISTTRDSEGREVAIKRVLVSESEIRRLQSTFDKLHNTFKNKTKTADRQDVKAILDELKQIVAETGAGQKFDAETNLNDVITDLPLRSPVLKMTPKDIAAMTSDAFTNWLEKLDIAQARCKDLLESQKDWSYLSEKAAYEKFTFLKLNELP
jgi:hypothetical protein